MYKCKKCGKEFENRYQLGGHSNIVHFNIFKDRYKDYNYKYIDKTCKYCNKIFKSRVGNKEKTFCSIQCSNTYRSQNKIKKERLLKRKIENTYKNSFIENKTKKQLFSLRKTWQSARSGIRKHAQNIYFKNYNKEYKCVVCGYNKYIEVCHKKSVSSFGDDTLIKDINNIDNLIGLCPNCHWEFDNNLLKIE